MQVNSAVRTPVAFTHEGAPAARINTEQELRRAVMACMLWEDSFYESGVAIADRIKDLVHKADLLKVFGIAIEARTRAKLRHVPLLLARELARHPHRAAAPHIVGDTIAEVIQRADELTEFLAIYWKDGKTPLSAQVKRGLARAFAKFSEYELAKYNRDKSVKLRDVLFLSHAKPLDAPGRKLTRFERKAGVVDVESAGEKLFQDLVNGTLETPDTWEVALSGGADKAETFTRLMTEKKLGALATLRNLRNMAQAGIPKAAVEHYLTEVNLERVLPFRFISAARAVPTWEDILEAPMLKCLEGAAKLAGRTVLLVDVSGSMADQISAKSDLNRLDAAKALAILLREICEDIVIIVFDTMTELVPPRRGFALADAIGQTRGGTDIGRAVQIGLSSQPDRLICLTDEQSATRVPQPEKHVKAYMINVANYRNGVGYGAWVHIDGWSEAIVDYIVQSEAFGDR